MDIESILRKIGAGCLIALMLISTVFAQDYLSGRVYKGNKGDQSNPLSGVTVKLYGSSNVGSLGNQIASTSTNSSGWYQVLAAAGFKGAEICFYLFFR